ncbi:MAG: hypothetical protein II334_02235 [Clostridia bacterium]|nr:hypothetical protein [Clostridia bacterium]MBQ5901054.1 hypothetical protein [Clostridia bacterium]
MAIYKLQNEFLTLTLESYGAEMQSILTKDGVELLYQGGEDWKGKAPNLYPIVGYLPEQKYIYEGKEYGIGGHGVARINDYVVESQSDTEIVFLLTQNEETLKQYPFNFEFRVKYVLNGKKVEYVLTATNTDSKTSYCEIGVHPGFPAPLGFEGVKFQFDGEEKYYTVKNLDSEKCGYRYIKEDGSMPLDSETFSTGAITFGGLNSKTVTLIRDGYDHDIRVDISDFPILSVWAAEDAHFVCIEPWSCESAHYCTSIELTEQVGISVLQPGESVSFSTAIEYIEK